MREKEEEFHEKAKRKKKRRKPQNTYLFHPQQRSIIIWCSNNSI